MGVPYDRNILAMIVAKHLSGHTAASSPFVSDAAMNGGNRWQQAAAASGVPAPPAGKANIEKLLADIAKLKSTIGQQGPGSSRGGSP